MDKFEQAMKHLLGLGEIEQGKEIFAYRSMCVCPTCPTYNHCAKTNNELLYCLLGKSPSCIKNLKKCACVRCPVSFKMSLSRQFYCSRGTETEQRMKKR